MRLLYALSIGSAAFESLLLAGNFYGWPSLQYVLTKEGYFRHSCDPLANSTEAPPTSKNYSGFDSCSAAEENFNLVFQLSLACLNVFTIFTGYVLDRWGTWAARTLGSALLIGGYSGLWLMNPSQSWLLFPSMILISSGGFLLAVTNNQLGNLVPKHRSLCITLLNGLVDSGTSVFLILKIAYDRGFDPKVFFAVMTALSCLCAARTFLLMPKTTVPHPLLNENYSYGIEDCRKRKAVSDPKHEVELKSENEEQRLVSSVKTKTTDEQGEKTPTFRSCVCSKLYVFHVIFYSTCYVRYVFVLGSAVTWMLEFQTETGVSFYTEVLGYMLTCGAFVAPINGLIADLVMKFYRLRLNDSKLTILRGLLAQVTLTALLQILLSVAILARELYTSFALLLFFRAFLFGTAFNFTAQAFPIEHFGKLMGVTQALVGVASLFQYALFKFAVDGVYGFTAVNTYLLFASVICLFHPFYLYVKAYAPNLSRIICTMPMQNSAEL